MGTKNVLIIDGNEKMQTLRARVLRTRGVHVHTAKNVTEAELLWVPDFFDLVLLDVRQRSKEAVEFWRTIRRQDPGQRIRFLVGPPSYLSPTRADAVVDRDDGGLQAEGEVGGSNERKVVQASASRSL
jgi:response regulator RpfG family c-di-GMP phosphodiesterase